ncbi:MAG: hypothetical protein ACREIC_12595, partial [Limisphaerales bacterium]
VYLGHLSRECNKPELAGRVVGERLAKTGAHHVRLEVTSQKVPCSTLELEARPDAPGIPAPPADVIAACGKKPTSDALAISAPPPPTGTKTLEPLNLF